MALLSDNTLKLPSDGFFALEGVPVLQGVGLSAGVLGGDTIGVPKGV